jgi:hypothetical protein
MKEWQSNHAFVSHGSRLDRGAVCHDADDRDDAIFGEVHVRDRLIDFDQYLPSLEHDPLEVRRDAGEVRLG